MDTSTILLLEWLTGGLLAMSVLSWIAVALGFALRAQTVERP